MDGWITIGTKLDSKELEKQLNQQRKQLERYSKEEEKLLQQKNKFSPKVEQARKKYYSDLEKENKRYVESQQTIKGNIDFYKSEGDTATVNRLEKNSVELTKEHKKNVSEITQEYVKQIKPINDIQAQITKNHNKQKQTKEQIEVINKELEKASGWQKIDLLMKNSTKELTNMIKQAGKYALAIFGIRSAYMMVRSAMSTISQYDKQMATDIEYIRWAIAMTLKPVVEWVVNLAKKLLGYLGAIFKTLFGVDLWANSSAEAFKRSKDNLGGAVKQAKTLEKTLAGFDEINILQSPSGSIGGGGGINAETIMPSFDFQKATNEIKPKWDAWVKKNFTWEGAMESIDKLMRDIKTGWNIFLEWSGWKQFVSNFTEMLNLLGIPQFLDDTKRRWSDFIKQLGLNKLLDELKKPWKGLKDFLDSFFKPKYNTKDLINNDGLDKKMETPFTRIKNWIKTEIIDKTGFNFDTLWTNIPKGANGMLSPLIGVFNGMIRGINRLIGEINKISIKIPNDAWIPDPYRGKTFGFNIKKIKEIELASGGIVDVPKTGVNLGRAIVGEAGAEGVLPLTNAETMARLGQEIGKWIVLNIDLTNTIDGRVLNRRLETLKNNRNFSTNGGE